LTLQPDKNKRYGADVLPGNDRSGHYKGLISQSNTGKYRET
jgi:hypothetical protein